MLLHIYNPEFMKLHTKLPNNMNSLKQKFYNFSPKQQLTIIKTLSKLQLEFIGQIQSKIRDSQTKYQNVTKRHRNLSNIMGNLQ